MQPPFRHDLAQNCRSRQARRSAVRVGGSRVNSAIGHSLILAGAGVAALVMSWGLERSEKPEPSAVVVTLPKRAPEPVVARAPIAPPQAPAPLPPDRDGLARELQRELQRVGCYDGDISGSWSAPSRRAMKAFTEAVNATLPVDQPDYILLRLVQQHRGRACGVTLAKATEPAPEPKPGPAIEKAAPAIVPAPVPVPRFRSEGNLAPNSTTAPRPERVPESVRESVRESARETVREPAPERPVRQAAAPQPVPPPPPQAAPSAMRESGPTPPAGVYSQRPRRTVRPSNKPPKFVRKFIRSVQQSLAPFGIR